MTRLLYFADPMCSWCYGFAPVIRRLMREHGDRFTLDLVMGGLRAGERRPITPAARAEILNHWHHVEQASGQKFDYEGGLPEGFVYDTEPPCRAVVTVRSLAPGRALEYLDALHHAFYERAEDIKAPAVLTALAARLGIGRDAFGQGFAGEQANEATRADFERTRDHGVLGFPCVILEEDGRKQILTMGYRPYDDVVEVLQRRKLLPVVGAGVG